MTTIRDSAERLVLLYNKHTVELSKYMPCWLMVLYINWIEKAKIKDLNLAPFDKRDYHTIVAAARGITARNIQHADLILVGSIVLFRTALSHFPDVLDDVNEFNKLAAEFTQQSYGHYEISKIDYDRIPAIVNALFTSINLQ